MFIPGTLRREDLLGREEEEGKEVVEVLFLHLEVVLLSLIHISEPTRLC